MSRPVEGMLSASVSPVTYQGLHIATKATGSTHVAFVTSTLSFVNAFGCSLSKMITFSVAAVRNR